MKKGLILIATIVAVILVGNVIVAYAQTGSQPAQPGTGVCPNGLTCPYSGTMPYGGMMGGRGQMGGMMNGNMSAMHDAMLAEDGMHETVMTAIAAELDMTYAELTTALQTQTLAQIAEAKGVALDALQQIATTARNAELDKLIAAGTLTQEQADWMKSHMQAMPNFGTGYGPGMMGGWQNNGQSGTYGHGMMGGRGQMPGGMMGGRGQMPGVPGGMMGGRGYAQPTGPQG